MRLYCYEEPIGGYDDKNIPVKYKSKSKMLTTPEQVAQTEEDIKALALVKDAVIKEDGQVVTVEVRMRKISNRLWTEYQHFQKN